MVKKICLIGMDIGTTGIKAVVVDAEKGFLASAGREHYYTSINPVKGYTEFDTEAWWKLTKEIIPEALNKAEVAPSEVKGICISALAPCVTPLDKDGNALRNGMIWHTENRIVLINDFPLGSIQHISKDILKPNEQIQLSKYMDGFKQ